MNYICNCLKSDFYKHKYSYWENRNITSDEEDIIEFLKNCEINLKTILHIGIGNSFFAKQFHNNNDIFGVTISQKEIDKAISLNLSNYKVSLCDKYSKNFMLEFHDKKFDVIVDTNLKSYSCCLESFNFYMENLLSKLDKNGILITSINGMKWYKSLRPKLSFDFKKFFHFKLKEVNGNEQNILTQNELKNLSKRFDLKFSFDTKLCYLKR